jgi:hypothetical protein
MADGSSPSSAVTFLIPSSNAFSPASSTKSESGAQRTDGLARRGDIRASVPPPYSVKSDGVFSNIVQTSETADLVGVLLKIQFPVFLLEEMRRYGAKIVAVDCCGDQYSVVEEFSQHP